MKKEYVYRVTDPKTGDTLETEPLPGDPMERLAHFLAQHFDRSMKVTEHDAGRIIVVDEADSGGEWMTIRDIAFELKRTRKAIYKLIGRDAKRTAEDWGVKTLPIRVIPGSKEYGALREEFNAWLKKCPQPVRLDKGRKRGRPRK